MTYSERRWNKGEVDAAFTTAVMFGTSFNEDLKLTTDVDTHLRSLCDAELNNCGGEWFKWLVSSEQEVVC